MIKTRKSNPNKPYRLLVYGVEGVGKSTFAANAEKPIFISAEGGTDRIKKKGGVDEMENIKSWDDVLRAVDELTNDTHGFKTVVLDSADWLEGLAHEKILAGQSKTITTVDGGYGSGYRKTQNMFQELVKKLSHLRDKKHMNVIFVAHAHVRPVKDPTLPEHDQFEIKLHEMPSSIIREWVDGVFFVRFKMFVQAESGRAFSDGTRALYTVRDAGYQAKNRFDMPPEFEFTTDIWKELMPYIKSGPVAQDEKPAEDTLSEINRLISELKDEKLKKTVQETTTKAGDDKTKLAKILERLQTLTKNKGDA